MKIAKTLATAINNPALGGGSSLTLKETADVLDFMSGCSDEDFAYIEAALEEMGKTGRGLSRAEKQLIETGKAPEPKPEPEPENEFYAENEDGEVMFDPEADAPESVQDGTADNVEE